MDSVHVVDHLAGLVPLRGRTPLAETHLVGQVNPRRGDLLALILLIDGAVRLRDVLPAGPVGRDSLRRVAACSVAHNGEIFTIADVVRNDGRVRLSARWRRWVTLGATRRAQLPWNALASASPGSQALLWALATERAQSVSMASLAKRCGSQVTDPFKRAQQIRRWLHALGPDAADWRARGDTVLRTAYKNLAG